MCKLRTNMASQPLKVLVVEDDPAILITLEHRLKREGFELRSVTDGGDALRITQSSWTPDIILLDIMLPTMDGFLLCESVRASNPVVTIVMLTARDSEDDIVRGLDAGADDYVTKPFSMVELLARMRAHVRGRTSTPGEPRTLIFGDLCIDTQNHVVSVKDKPVTLRLKEFQILATLAESAGQLLSRQELVHHVWGYRRGAQGRTVDVHVRRIRAAVESLSDYTFIQTVIGLGYRFEPIPNDPSDPSDREASSSINHLSAK